MKWFVSIMMAAATLLPIRAQAFSEDFKRDMTAVQRRVMLVGEKFSPADVKQMWSRYDSEIINLLSNSKNASEAALNKETQRVELVVTESKGTETDWIELGDISVYLQELDSKREVWLAILYNGMYQGSTPLPFSTIRIYKKIDGQFTRTAALEDIKGEWDQSRIQNGTIQLQNLGGRKSVKFATFFAPPRKPGELTPPSRSEIIWEYQDDLKPLEYRASVDD